MLIAATTCVAFFFGALGTAGVAQAASCAYWYGPGGSGSEAQSGEWGEKANWSTDEVPEGQTQVCITVPGTYTVTLIPYPDTHYAGYDGGAAESLTIGASNGTQKLQVLGEAHGFEGDWYNVTSLGVADGVTVGPHGVLALEATEQDAPNQTPGGSAGSTILLETDTSGQPGHPFLIEGALLTATSSSKYGDEIHSHALTNSGSLQVSSGTLKLYNEEPAISTGSITVAAGATLLQERGANFTNEGSVTNSGTLILNGYPGKPRWIQGTKGSVTGNVVNIEAGGGLEESTGSGPGGFNLGGNGAAYVLGTIPKGQTITFVDATGQTTVFLGNATLVNEGTIHVDLPAGDESNTNIEEGSIVNKGTIYGTVEGTKAKNVIDVPLTNEAGAVLAATSGTLFDNREITNNGTVQIASGSLLELVAVKFVNGAGGTISPQISGASTFGKIQLSFHTTIEAGGTIAPALMGGFTPTNGEEFDVIEGAGVNNTFATVSGGFTGDYTHVSSEPAYFGVVYGGGGGTTTTTNAPTVSAIKGGKGKLTATLSCPAGGASCSSAKIVATVTEHLKGSKVTAISAAAKSKAKAKTKQVVIASSSATLAAGAKKTITLALNATGKKLLAKYGKLQTLVTVTVNGKVIEKKTVKLTEPAKGKKKAKKKKAH
ncbi:MAG TPA: hypothetical protein VGF95_11950 [Solirubrobacteraceae bacterium]|jgi:hypothetical protein